MVCLVSSSAHLHCMVKDWLAESAVPEPVILISRLTLPFSFIDEVVH
jgi:hypothetical protein